MKFEKFVQNKQNKKVVLNLLEKKLLSYSIAAGAALITTENAQAIQFRDLGDIMISNDSFLLDFNDDGKIDFNIFHSHLSMTSPYVLQFSGASGAGAISKNGFVGANFFISKLNAGDTIGENDDFIRRGNFGSIYNSQGSTQLYGNFLGAQNAFFGVKFNDISGNRLFGWGRVSMPDDGSKITLHDLAYNEISDEPIRAGQMVNDDPPGGTPIPEPGTLGMLALGAIGVCAWRKRKERSM